MNYPRGPRAKAIAIELSDFFRRGGGGGGGPGDDQREPTKIEKIIKDYAGNLISREREKLEGKLSPKEHGMRLSRDKELVKEFNAFARDDGLRGTWNAIKVIFKYEFVNSIFSPA